MYRRIALGCMVVAALALPATASANHLTRSDFKNAAKYCKALRAELNQGGANLFGQMFGSNDNRRNAFGKCVARHVRLAHRARRQAVRECRAEIQAAASPRGEERGRRPDTPGERGLERGNRGERGERRGHERRRLLRRCVAERVRQAVEERRNAVVNAAKQCAEERSQNPVAFRNTYGTNDNKRNAFGKCVSQKVRAETPTPSS